MTAFIDDLLTTVAFCWRLERRDGVALGFTTQDRDLEIDGLVYRAAPGMVPSAISISDGFDAGALEISGALSSAAIAADDLVAGRWDGAAVFLFACDWEQGGATLPLARGEIGDVTAKGAGFEAELRGPTALLERPVVEQTSPECRAELGDRRCRVDLAPRTRVTRVAAVVDDATIEVEAAAPEADAYAYGRLRWLGGANSGLDSAIVASDGVRLTLLEAPFRPVTVGDLVEIREGCDKAFATCTGRFANGLNFRGEPHLPGMDLLTRYPGAS
ncbi:MAG: DUF2163 domain-containing protein [Alphaproteobacteria bacterium]|nr:DUF2163 domain-containing protein [Alphaproteobacteria bacterium]